MIVLEMLLLLVGSVRCKAARYEALRSLGAGGRTQMLIKENTCFFEEFLVRMEVVGRRLTARR